MLISRQFYIPLTICKCLFISTFLPAFLVFLMTATLTGIGLNFRIVSICVFSRLVRLDFFSCIQSTICTSSFENYLFISLTHLLPEEL